MVMKSRFPEWEDASIEVADRLVTVLNARGNAISLFLGNKALQVIVNCSTARHASQLLSEPRSRCYCYARLCANWHGRYVIRIPN